MNNTLEVSEAPQRPVAALAAICQVYLKRQSLTPFVHSTAPLEIFPEPQTPN
ncbi:hypothetical protein SFA35_09335 [Pseudomonas sp. HR96]|uniref:hypothetical protein n=1 Tax=Pseudomonas sp. HR96 TaxID=1027966 RepID=UPI002A755D3C|nr:hypothetical protein [Pseudomonas sp. HR96]WPP01531.1 hypothetical protein SFA35_09335 [Pseudomonas sp. HR96]